MVSQRQKSRKCTRKTIRTLPARIVEGRLFSLFAAQRALQLSVEHPDVRPVARRQNGIETEVMRLKSYQVWTRKVALLSYSCVAKERASVTQELQKDRKAVAFAAQTRESSKGGTEGDVTQPAGPPQDLAPGENFEKFT